MSLEEIVELAAQKKATHEVDRELREIESRLFPTLLPEVVKQAQMLRFEYLERFSTPPCSTIQEAVQFRYVYVPILYKLGMSNEASQLAQATFLALFPQLEGAVQEEVNRLFGTVSIEGLSSFRRGNYSYRIKSPHSIWRKVESLEALSKMNRAVFAACVKDFIGFRWVMEGEGNQYDALIEGVRQAPLENLKSFRNQQLPQASGFDREPVMKLCYVTNGLPIELQILGGDITNYLSAKGYAQYKATVPLPAHTASEDKRLGLASQPELAHTFRKCMYAELVGEEPDYSPFAPFILDSAPKHPPNQTLRFSTSPTPICALPHLTFETNPTLEGS